MKASYELNPYEIDAIEAPDAMNVVLPKPVLVTKRRPNDRAQNNRRAMGHALAFAQKVHPRVCPEPQILEIENPEMADDDIFLPEPEFVPVAATVTKERLSIFDRIANVVGDVAMGIKEALTVRKLAYAGGAALATTVGINSVADMPVDLQTVPTPVYEKSEKAQAFGDTGAYQDVKQYLDKLDGYGPVLQHVEMWGAKNVHQMLNLVDSEFGEGVADNLESVIETHLFASQTAAKISAAIA